MKLRVRLGRRTVVCSLDDSHGEPTVTSAKEEVRNQFELANVSFSLSLNSSDVLDEDANMTLSDLGIVSGDLIFVIVPDAHVISDDGAHGGDIAMAAPETGTAHSEQTEQGQNILSPQPVTGSPSTGPAMSCSQGLMITTTDNPDELLIHDSEAIRDAMSNQYLNEPMFIRDSTSMAVPQSLRTIVERGDVENCHDALCTVLHLLMLEAGFRSLPSVSSDQQQLAAMPQQWKYPGTYRLNYEHPACEGSSFQLLCVPLGSAITIHGRVKLSGDAESQTRELNLNVNEFVQQNHSQVTEMFHNLPKLSRLFKDGLVYWLLQMAQPDGEVFFIPCLMGLPVELKLMVLTRLDAVSLVRLSAVCKELLVASRDRFLWRMLYLTDFGRRTDNDLAQDWLKLYRDKAEERRSIRETYQQQTLIYTSNPFQGSYPPFNPYVPRYDPFNPFHPATPMYPPGFIGGEYDLRPNFPAPFGGGVPRPRFDPFLPYPNPHFRPGRGGGPWATRGRFGPRFI